MPARKYKTDPAQLLAEGQQIVHTTSDARYRHKVEIETMLPSANFSSTQTVSMRPVSSHSWNSCQRHGLSNVITLTAIQTIPAADHIAPEVFRDYAGEVPQGTGRVTAALDIDLDHDKFSTLSALNSWVAYTVRDVSTAAWHASRKDGLRWERRLEVFTERLVGKEITPEHRMDVSQISFADDIIEMDGRLNFYVENDFDPDYAFGTYVCTDENDDWVNVYANYDIGKGQVCSALEINLCRGDGTEKTMLYHLSSAEKKVLLQKMDAFCQEVTGQSLKDYCAQTQAEDMEPSAGQTMG